MIELPGWNDLISVNGFCYSSSMGESPKLNIPLKTSTAPTKGIAPATFARNSTKTYIDNDGILQTAEINVIGFQNGRYLCEPPATNRFLQSGTPATQTITVVSGTVYTVQCYGSGSITLSGAGTGSVVEGSPRTFTASSTSLICAVSGSLNRAQVEAGTQATSYIPTTSTTVTREADVLHYAVGDIITQGQGSLYCEFVSEVVSTANKLVLCITNGTSLNRIDVYINTTNKIQLGIRIAGVSKYTRAVMYVESGLNKVVVAYADNNYRLYFNGFTAGSTSDAIIVPDFNRLSIGCRESGTLQLGGEIGNIKYFKEVLIEAQAIKLTTL